MPTNMQLEALVKKLEQRVEELEQKAKEVIVKVEEVKDEAKPVTIEEYNKYPVPLDYRNIVDTVLNPEFGLSVEPATDRPMFTLRIVVPEKYSNLNAEEKRMLGADFRIKVIDYASGANGVREYAELVFKSFNPQIQSMIVADRVK